MVAKTAAIMMQALPRMAQKGIRSLLKVNG